MFARTLAFVALLGLSCAAKDKKHPAEIGSRDVGKGLNLYSLEKEIALGKQLALEVERQAKLLDDPIVTEYVNRLGQNLVRHSDIAIPVSIKVIESPDLNAFALPGGFVFINTGLIRLSETEAELAAAMSHELAHVAARHATRQASRDRLINMATLPLGAAGGVAGTIARQATGVGVPLSLLRFSRAFETEADALGLAYLYRAGYDPSASVDIFERIESTERKRPGAVSRLFDTHPMTSDRIRRTQKAIDSILPGKPEFVVTTSEYEDVRARLMRLSASARPASPALRKAIDSPVIRPHEAR